MEANTKEIKICDLGIVIAQLRFPSKNVLLGRSLLQLQHYSIITIFGNETHCSQLLCAAICPGFKLFRHPSSPQFLPFVCLCFSFSPGACPHHGQMRLSVTAALEKKTLQIIQRNPPKAETNILIFVI